MILQNKEDFLKTLFKGDENYKILISGGNVSINASGDGIDSNGNIEISGGVVLVDGPISGGEGALDYGLEAKITGGILVAAGSSGMAQGLSSDSEVPSVMLYFNEVQEAQTRVTILDEDNNVIISFVPQKEYQSIVLSSEKLEEGNTYTLMSEGGTIEGEDTNFAEDGKLEGAQELTTVTIDQISKSISEDGTERKSWWYDGSTRPKNVIFGIKTVSEKNKRLPHEVIRVAVFFWGGGILLQSILKKNSRILKLLITKKGLIDKEKNKLSVC